MKYIVKRFLNCVQDIDIILLQEVKVVGFALKCIWKDAAAFSTKHPKGKGGTSILVKPKWRKNISQWGNSPCNKSSRISFKIEDFEFGICSIYAPNDHPDRIKLWQWLSSLSNIPWILAGDFNMVQRSQDKAGGLKFEWKSNEQYFWNRMLNKLNLIDPLAELRQQSKRLLVHLV